MDSAKSPAEVSIESFFTRQRANEGIELPLDKPDGTPTAHRIRIRGTDSDVFREAYADSHRQLQEIILNRDAAKATPAELQQARIKLLASLVISWTFSTDCTQENVIHVLTEAPQIADQIDRIASRRALFFRNGSTNSLNSPVLSSS